MPTDTIKYAIDNFIEEKYVLYKQSEYELFENDEGGESLLIVNVEEESICVTNYDKKKKCSFIREDKKYGMKKCVDHFIIINKNGLWQLHMFEMKTTVGTQTWNNIKLKFRSSYLNICALCVFLGITIDETFAYTTYSKEKFDDIKNTANPSTMKAPLGFKPPQKAIDEWNEGKVTLNFGYSKTFDHIKIKMEKVDERLKSSLKI
jgi:hypothetical protein